MSTDRLAHRPVAWQKALRNASRPWAVIGLIAVAGLSVSCRRSDPPPAAVVPVPPPVVVAPAPPPVDVVRSVAQAIDGGERAQTLVLPPSDFAQVGDLLRIVDGTGPEAHLIATALVIDHADQGITARVIALGRRSRPVAVGDRCQVAPAPAAPVATVASGTAAPSAPQSLTAPQPQMAVQAPPQASPAVAAHGAAHNATMPVFSATAAPSADAGEVAAAMRAQLEAERAYFLLAAQVLRLPPDDPAVQALQARMRHELAQMLGTQADSPQSESTTPADHHPPAPAGAHP